MIEAALNERSARGEKTDRQLVHVAVRQIPLETRGVWVGMCLSPWAAGCTARCSACGGRNTKWGKSGADGAGVDGAGSPGNCFAVLAGCSIARSLLPICLVAEGETPDARGFCEIAPTRSHTRRKGG
jgi:hypothetical protein